LSLKSIFTQKLSGKTVLLRVDLNSSIVEGRVVVSSRIREHAKTVYSLCEEGAKVVVLSHQGRKGDADFIPLKRHSDFIKKFTGRKVKFVTWKEDFRQKIREMKNSEVVVMDNTRFFDIETDEEKTPEEFAAATPVKELVEVSDFFVQDALSISHRNNATVVGPPIRLKSFVGPVLERELEALNKLNSKSQSKLLILGGAKPSDSIQILESMLSKKYATEVCLGGFFGEVFLSANGVKLGKKDALMKEKGFDKLVPKAKEILSKYGNKIILPVDVGAKLNEVGAKPNGHRKELKVSQLPTDMDIMDIGDETTELFKKKVRESKVVVFNGPMGVYENKSFSIGTKKLLETIAFSRCYSIVGGGDTERALLSIGLLPQDFKHVSLAGKALLEYLAGEELPGLKILERN
jgi:phosphoglycerate kinase